VDHPAGFVWRLAPEVFSFSPLPRWYGLIFMCGVLASYFITRRLFVRDGLRWELADRLLVYVIVGMIVGMRLGHCLFYQPEIYLKNPIQILMIWEGGYASHGGFLGVIIALIIFARRYVDGRFLFLGDRVSVGCMLAAAGIRVGNFFNSEMIGRPSSEPWAVTFALVDNVPRHPTQLYEAIGYVVIFAIGYALARPQGLLRQPGRLLGVIMILGFSWRFFVEFFKVEQVAFEADMSLNMGQWLSVPFVLLGIALALNLQAKWRATPEAAKPATPPGAA
jgi:prolipoprotein diacylglyceryl transferase